MLPFPDIILPGILPTTLHGDHPLEELHFHLGSFVFVHATGFLKHCARPPLGKKKKRKKKKCFLAKHRWQFDGMKSSQGYDTVCKGCSSSAWLMRNRCYESLSNTVKLRLLSDSRGAGVNSCRSDSPVSHRQKAEQSCVVSTLALRLLHVDPHRSWL